MTFAPSLPPSRPAVAASAQDLDDAEFAELDELLASVPEPLQPLDAVMLDGFLCGIVVQPMLLDASAWLPYVFDAGGHRWGEAEPSPERARAEALVLRRHAALNRSIAEFGGFHPFILEPAADGGEDDATPARLDPITAAVQPWVAGLASAVELFPGLADMPDAAVTTTLARLYRFLPAEGEQERGVLEVVERERPLRSLDDAIDEIVMCVGELYDLTAPLRYKVEPVRRDAPKVGRNDPCPCGSGRKWKLCHGKGGSG